MRAILQTVLAGFRWLTVKRLDRDRTVLEVYDYQLLGG
jgi:hypothetical protein